MVCKILGKHYFPIQSTSRERQDSQLFTCVCGQISDIFSALKNSSFMWKWYLQSHSSYLWDSLITESKILFSIAFTAMIFRAFFRLGPGIYLKFVYSASYLKKIYTFDLLLLDFCVFVDLFSSYLLSYPTIFVVVIFFSFCYFSCDFHKKCLNKIKN